MVAVRAMSLSQFGEQTKASRLMLLSQVLTDTTCGTKEPCEHYAESKKHSYYDEDFKGTSFGKLHLRSREEKSEQEIAKVRGVRD